MCHGLHWFSCQQTAAKPFPLFLCAALIFGSYHQPLAAVTCRDVWQGLYPVYPRQGLYLLIDTIVSSQVTNTENTDRLFISNHKATHY